MSKKVAKIGAAFKNFREKDFIYTTNKESFIFIYDIVKKKVWAQINYVKKK